MNQINVKLFDKEIGSLWIREGIISFRYNDDFIVSSIEPSPVIMPKQKNVEYTFTQTEYQCFRHLPPLAADSLPDAFGNEILHTYLEKMGRKEEDLTPLERLSYVGENGMGAISYVPAKAALTSYQKDIDLETIREISQKVLDASLGLDIKLTNSEKDVEALATVLALGGSVQGARSKALIYRKGNIFKSGRLSSPPKGFVPQIIKFQDVKKTIDNTKVEYIYHKMAVQSGITMMNCELIENNGYYHFTTDRFDRTTTGEKFHTQTLCAMLGRDHNTEFQKLDTILRLVNDLTGDERQVKEMFRRMLFNIMSVNRDDHSKNTSFIMDKKGRWALSPAYDLCYTYTKNPAEWSHNHHTTVNGKRKEITMKDIENEIIPFRTAIEKPRLILEQIGDSIREFPALAKEYDVTPAKTKTIVEMMNTVYKQLNNTPVI